MTSCPRSRQLRARITLQLTPAELAAVRWLSNCPREPEDVPEPYRQHYRKPARTIARELSGDQIRELVSLAS